MDGMFAACDNILGEYIPLNMHQCFAMLCFALLILGFACEFAWYFLYILKCPYIIQMCIKQEYQPIVA